MTDYADLEKRLRDPERANGKTPIGVYGQMLREGIEAADAIAALTRKLEEAEHAAKMWEKQYECCDAQCDKLKVDVIAFCGPHAARYAQDFGLAKGELHPVHYDILARCGARMDDFTRADRLSSTRQGQDDAG